MKTVTCIHPIKVNKVIRKFVEKFYDSSIDVIIEHENNSLLNYAVCGDIDDDEIIIYVPNWKIADYKHDFGGKCFRKNFVERCPLAKGFSDVTISLLHEIGHTMTKDYLPDDYDRMKEYKKINTIKGKTARTFAYFHMLDEGLATDWAIEWLQDKDNRKTARKFEKKFWACFK